MTKLKQLIVICLLFVLLQHDALAQKQVNELTLSYDISIVSTANKAAQAKPLDGAKLDLYIKKTESRSDMLSSLGKESNIYDSKTGNGVILKEYSGQKLMITLTKENWNQKNQYFKTMQFSIDQAEQVVAGFKCRKATAKTENGKEFIVYFLPDVVPVNRDYHNVFTQLPGIPVKYELESGNLKFTYTLTNINYDIIPAGKFDEPKSGYRIMTYDESQQLKKG